MKRRFLISLSSIALMAMAVCSSIRADDDFRPLFNGKDLSGWVPVNVAETFTVRDGDDRLDG